MDAVDFIKKDIGRGSRKSNSLMLLFVAGIFLIPILLGVLMRDDFDGVFVPRTLVPNLLAAIGLSFCAVVIFLKNFASRKILPVCITSLTLAIFLATEKIFYPSGLRTVYPDVHQFWHEAGRCFSKGSLTTMVVGSWLTLFSYTILSWPNRLWRVILSILAGVSAAVMLGFHCDSSSVGHVLIGHIGPGVLAGLFRLLFAGICLPFLSRKKLPPT